MLVFMHLSTCLALTERLDCQKQQVEESTATNSMDGQVSWPFSERSQGSSNRGKLTIATTIITEEYIGKRAI